MRIGGSQSHMYIGPKILVDISVPVAFEAEEDHNTPKVQVIIMGQPKPKKARKKRLRNALVELKEQNNEATGTD